MVARAMLALVLLPGLATAASVEAVEVEHSASRYTIDMRVRVGVAAADAFAVMTDYANLPSVNDNVVVAEQLADGRLRTVVAICIAFFCKHVRQVQQVTAEAGRRLRMRVLPELSDFRFGKAEWHFEALGAQQSRITFQAEIKPDFWIPPLIGPWLIKRKMQAQAVKTATGIERRARAR